MDSIKHAFYINLESRTDRKKHIEAQLLNINIKAERFNAVKLENGAIGCSMSHLRCLKIAKENKWDHLLIIEDDAEFSDPELFKCKFDTFLKTHDDWDVVLLGGNNIPPYKVIDETCVKVTKCQTTTCYMVKGHYFETLINNIKDGIDLLLKNNKLRVHYAIDKYWFKLQERDNWFLIVPLTVFQKEDYSDIEKKTTNNKNMMLDLDKKEFFIDRLKQINNIKARTTNANEIKKLDDAYKMVEELIANPRIT